MGVSSGLGHLGEGGGGAEGGLRGAHRRRLGVRVHDVGNGLVVGLTGFAEDVGGDDLALVLPHVGQQPHAGDVANGPQTVADAQVGVDRDAVPVSVDADCVEADPVHAGAPARGEEQVVAAHLAAVIEYEDVVLAVASGRRRLDAQHQFDSVAA